MKLSLLVTLLQYSNKSSIAYISDTKLHCIFLQETYSITDYELYDPTGFSKTTTTSTDTSYPTGYGWSKSDTGDFEIEFDFNAPEKMRLYLTKTNVQTQGTDIQYGIGVTRSSGKLQYTNRTTSSSNTTCGTMASGARRIKWTIEGTTVKLYMDGTLQTTKTVSWMGYPLYFAWSIWTANTATVSNIKVKPL